MSPRTARHLLCLVLLVLIFFATLTGCAVEPPRPFEAGPQTSPPPGCETLRQRNGEC